MGMSTQLIGLSPQFRERVLSAISELKRGDTPAEVRERHGAVVLRAALGEVSTGESREA